MIFLIKLSVFKLTANDFLEVKNHNKQKKSFK